MLNICFLLNNLHNYLSLYMKCIIDLEDNVFLHMYYIHFHFYKICMDSNIINKYFKYPNNKSLCIYYIIF